MGSEDEKYPSEEYSLNNDEDFQLSASLKKSEGNNTNQKVTIEARERLQKLQREEEAEKRNKAIGDKVEAQMKKIDGSDSSDSEDKIQNKSSAKKKADAYDYFLNKEKGGVVTESDDFSVSAHSQHSIVIDKADVHKNETF